MHRHPELPKAFADLGLETPVLRALQTVGYTDPSDIQSELVPIILEGKDVLGQARTGTGKTAAFGMPILQLIDPNGGLQAIILTPTRELAAQVLGELRRLAQYIDIRCVPVYGGTRMREQLHQLGKKPQVIVGTPGRVIDVIGRGAVKLDSIRFAVLDEVDRMLDIGFRDDIRRILGGVKTVHQTVLVSATIDDEIKRLSKQYMNDPVEINVSRDQITVGEVSQYYCTVDPWDKARLLKLILEQEDPPLSIVFCNTKHGVRKLTKRLFAIGVDAKDIHGDLIQQKRERIMDRFRRHKIKVLVATDLAARGIDVHNITHIFNFDLPQDREIYVHRIGRTARMGAEGKAISFVTREQGEELSGLEMLINQEISKLEVEGFQPSPPPRERTGASPAFAGTATPSVTTAPTPPPKPRNLGGKFPVRRRRL